MTEPYDPTEHHRERARKAEQRVSTLEHELSKTIRLLALAVRAAASNECDPHTLLQVLEQHDERNNRLEQTLRLLQATNVFAEPVAFQAGRRAPLSRLVAVEEKSRRPSSSSVESVSATDRLERTKERTS